MASHLAYVQARLQARHGGRPGEERWRLLESTTDLGGYLQQARNTDLEPWIKTLTPQADAHRIEQSLRGQWRAYSAGIADWAPSDWRPAVRWTGSLPDLPFVVHLARGRSVPRWMLLDPVLAPLALEDPRRREEALDASGLAAVVQAVNRNVPPVEAWLDAWEQTWPPEGDRAGLDRLRDLVSEHMRRILAEPAARHDGAGLHADLARKLTVLFRREAGRMGAVFAHLGLMSLDIERLRGGLVLRALFPDARERPAWA